MESQLKPKTVVILDMELAVEPPAYESWRSYHLSSQGDSLVELQAYAYVTEIDEDGNTLFTYDLEDAPAWVREPVLRCLSANFFQAQMDGKVELL